jgi:hypothetical protein
MAFLQNDFGVRLCWALEEPKGPEGPKGPKGSSARALQGLLEIKDTHRPYMYIQDLRT